MPLLLTPRNTRGGAARLPAALRRDGGSIAIGRDPASDLPLDHPLVSGRHCTIVGSGGAWQLHDTSTNGTLLNGERVVGGRSLRSGDVIGVGETEIAVQIDVGSQPGTGDRRDDWGRGAPTGTARPALAASHQASTPAAATDALTRSAIEGIASLSQTRRKAREQLGAPVASDQADPFAGPGDVLARLQAMPTASAAGAVTAACEALASHERALLAAMQGTFRKALDQFAPASIKQRAKSDADAWKAYERAFAASDGFVDTFAQELAKAYRDATDR